MLFPKASARACETHYHFRSFPSPRTKLIGISTRLRSSARSQLHVCFQKDIQVMTTGISPYVTPDPVDTEAATNIIETTIKASVETVDIGGGVMMEVSLPI
jgi:uncharacterized Fe-S cluster protein YjdI